MTDEKLTQEQADEKQINDAFQEQKAGAYEVELRSIPGKQAPQKSRNNHQSI